LKRVVKLKVIDLSAQARMRCLTQPLAQLRRATGKLIQGIEIALPEQVPQHGQRERVT
jgi:hypothetical protein